MRHLLGTGTAALQSAPVWSSEGRQHQDSDSVFLTLTGSRLLEAWPGGPNRSCCRSPPPLLGEHLPLTLATHHSPSQLSCGASQAVSLQMGKLSPPQRNTEAECRPDLRGRAQRGTEWRGPQ